MFSTTRLRTRGWNLFSFPLSVSLRVTVWVAGHRCRSGFGPSVDQSRNRHRDSVGLVKPWGFICWTSLERSELTRIHSHALVSLGARSRAQRDPRCSSGISGNPFITLPPTGVFRVLEEVPLFTAHARHVFPSLGCPQLRDSLRHPTAVLTEGEQFGDPARGDRLVGGVPLAGNCPMWFWEIQALHQRTPTA